MTIKYLFALARKYQPGLAGFFFGPGMVRPAAGLDRLPPVLAVDAGTERPVIL